MKTGSAAPPARLWLAAALLLGLYPSVVPAQPVRARERLQFFRTVVVEEGETVGEVTCIACSVLVYGLVEDDIVTVAGNVIVAGEVAGEIVVVGGDLVVADGVPSPEEIVVVGGFARTESGGVPEGMVEESPWTHLPGQRALHWQGMLVFVLVNFSAIFLGGLVVRPRRWQTMAASLQTHYAWVPAVGLLLFLCVGYGYALAEWLGRWEDWGYAALHLLLLGVPWLGYPALAYLIGSAGGDTARPWATLLSGAAGTTLLLLIPALGFLLFLLWFVLGFGLVAGSGLGKDADWLRGRLTRRGG